MFGFDSSQLGETEAYKFRYEQGLTAANRALSRNRALTSGNRLGALTDYGQNAASQEYEAEFGRQFDTNQYNNQARQLQYGMDQGRFNTQMDRLQGMGTGGFNAASTLGTWRQSTAGNRANVRSGNVANQFAASLIPVQEKMNYISGLMNMASAGMAGRGEPQEGGGFVNPFKGPRKL